MPKELVPDIPAAIDYKIYLTAKGEEDGPEKKQEKGYVWQTEVPQRFPFFSKGKEKTAS